MCLLHLLVCLFAVAVQALRCVVTSCARLFVVCLLFVWYELVHQYIPLSWFPHLHALICRLHPFAYCRCLCACVRLCGAFQSLRGIGRLFYIVSLQVTLCICVCVCAYGLTLRWSRTHTHTTSGCHLALVRPLVCLVTRVVVSSPFVVSMRLHTCIGHGYSTWFYTFKGVVWRVFCLFLFVWLLALCPFAYVVSVLRHVLGVARCLYIRCFVRDLTCAVTCLAVTCLAVTCLAVTCLAVICLAVGCLWA